jgi:F-type H+-transporting ATPase subunit c
MFDIAYAAEAASEAAASSVSLFTDRNLYVSITMFAGAAMPALSIGWIGSKSVEAIGRNPEAAAKIQTAMVLSVAFAEAIAIYSLVVSLIIKFV